MDSEDLRRGLTPRPQPKKLDNIRDFLKKARRKDATEVKMIKTKDANNKVATKFKLRTSRYLYTFVMSANEKADKVKQSLPPTLKKVSIKGA